MSAPKQTPQSIREGLEKAFRKEYGWPESQNMMYVPEFYATALWSARWMAERIQIHTHSACSQDCCSDHTDKFIDKVLKELQ